MRWGLSDRATAALVNAALVDFGLVSSQDTSIIVDRQRVRRAKESCRKNINASHGSQMNQGACIGLYFDGKEIETLVVLQEEGHNKNVMIKQEHTVLVSEPDGKYLGHVTTDGKSAEAICDALAEYLGSHDLLPDVKVLGADSTATNTGVNSGIFRRFEVERGLKVHWSICLLHTNELPLRHLIERVDGPTSGSNSFQGPIGKSLMKVTEWAWNDRFRSIKKGPNLPVLPETVFADLSSDQKYLYLAVSSIKSGKIDDRIRHLTPGPVCHSRWLTTACRIMCGYMKRHPFKGQDRNNLFILVFFVVTNYAPCWFAIKLRPHISDAPSHVLLAVQLLRLLPKKTRDIVTPYVKSWHAHPENLLVALLCSDDESERLHAVDKIQLLRNGNQYGDTSPRPFYPPKLNLKA